MMNELHEMSKRMNALNLKIKELKKEAESWETDEKMAHRGRVAARRTDKAADITKYSQIIDDCIINLKAIYGKLEYNKTALTLMKQEYQRAVRYVALTELYNHIDAHDGKRWTKRNIDKLEAVLTPLFEPLGIRCYVSLNRYNYQNIDINFYYTADNTRDDVTAWRMLDENKYINPDNTRERATVNYDLNQDFYSWAANVLNAKNQIKKLKEQIQELEKSIPYCVA